MGVGGQYLLLCCRVLPSWLKRRGWSSGRAAGLWCGTHGWLPQAHMNAPHICPPSLSAKQRCAINYKSKQTNIFWVRRTKYKGRIPNDTTGRTFTLRCPFYLHDHLSEVFVPVRFDPIYHLCAGSISDSLSQEMRPSDGFLLWWWSAHCSSRS